MGAISEEWLRRSPARDRGTARVIDEGAIEMHLPMWLRMWGAPGTGTFNIKIVR
jgi:hypothetical protein